MKSQSFKSVAVSAVAAMALVGFIAAPASADLITNSGFESVTSTTGQLPTGYGYWRGDNSLIVDAMMGISPASGSHMLHFINTTANGPSGAVGSELWQIVDVSSFSSLIHSGSAIADASSMFNRVDAGELTDSRFSVSLYAYSGSVDSFPSQWGQSELASADAGLLSDSDIATWQQLDLHMLLPTNTDFVVLRVAATENVFNDVSGIEFAGHFADNVNFNLVPSPSAFAGLLLGGIGFAGVGRRRRQSI